jgi:hypothetical protein
MNVESASSIQKVDSDDSIAAYRHDAADFFNTIGHLQPSRAIPRDGSLSPHSCRARWMLPRAESGQLRTQALHKRSGTARHELGVHKHKTWYVATRSKGDGTAMGERVTPLSIGVELYSDFVINVKK